MRYTVIMLVLFLFACGQEMEINYHYDVSEEALQHMAGEEVWGFAYEHWESSPGELFSDHPAGHRVCDIWLIAKEKTYTEDCWNKLIEHEKRHCYEGSFHPNTPDYHLQCDMN